MFPFPASGHPVTRLQRAGLLLSGLAVLLILSLSRQVHPDSRGLGTHEQFGLPPCTFHVTFGVPCPSCGGTTSFAHFVRGEFWQAAQANAAAFLGACLCVMYVPWAWLSGYCGRLCWVQSPLSLLLSLLIPITLIACGQWAVRVMIQHGWIG